MDLNARYFITPPKCDVIQMYVKISLSGLNKLFNAASHLWDIRHETTISQFLLFIPLFERNTNMQGNITQHTLVSPSLVEGYCG